MGEETHPFVELDGGDEIWLLSPECGRALAA